MPGRATAELPAADIHKKGFDSVFVKTVIAGILSTRQTAAALTVPKTAAISAACTHFVPRNGVSFLLGLIRQTLLLIVTVPVELPHLSTKNENSQKFVLEKKVCLKISE